MPMTTTPMQAFALYHRATGTKSKRWRLVSVHPTQGEARRAAFELGSGDLWITTIEPVATTSTEVTNAKVKNFKTASHH